MEYPNVPVWIGLSTSSEVGGCNGCDDHVTADGMKEHRVRRIKFRHGTEVRLCDDCYAQLREQVR